MSQTIPLKYVAVFNDATLPEVTDDDFEFRYVDISAVGQGTLLVPDELMNFASAPSRARRLAKSGDTVVSTVRTYLRAVCNVPETDEVLAFSTGFAVVSPCPKCVAPKFLTWQLQSDTFIAAVEAISSGVSYPATTARDVAGLKIRVPPMPEQIKIVDFLDREIAKIDALIAKQEQLIAVLIERRKAELRAALNQSSSAWNRLQIKRLGPVLRGASPRPIDSPIYFDDTGERGWVRISDVTASGGRLTEMRQRLSTLGASLSAPLDPGALFLSIAGSVGKPCITEVPVCVHDGFVYFPSLDEPAIEFLFRVFELGDCFGGLGKLGTQLNLNTDTVGGIEIALPATSEQATIVSALRAKLEKIDELVVKARELVHFMKERRSALIASAVTGQLDVDSYVA